MSSGVGVIGALNAKNAKKRGSSWKINLDYSLSQVA